MKKKQRKVYKPRIPIEAEKEIMRLLGGNMTASTEQVAEILEKHGVHGDSEALQLGYRKRVGQRLMASLRDEKGNREVLCGAKEYVVVDGCADTKKLKSIRGKLHKSMSGLDNSAKKGKGRLSFLSRFGGGKWKS